MSTVWETLNMEHKQAILSNKVLGNQRTLIYYLNSQKQRPHVIHLYPHESLQLSSDKLPFLFSLSKQK